MPDNRDLLQTIDAAVRRAPFCEQCGQPTTVAERDDELWLECSGLANRRGRLQRLAVLDFPSLHTRRPIVQLREAA